MMWLSNGESRRGIWAWLPYIYKLVVWPKLEEEDFRHAGGTTAGIGPMMAATRVVPMLPSALAMAMATSGTSHRCTVQVFADRKIIDN
jgi:hypothetical protein